LFLATLATASSQPLSAPTGLTVESDGETFRGHWTPVKGASYYEVWIEKFGRWSFNEKEFETSPFTSSFEIRVADERSRFKVRAMSADGESGAFSAVVKARLVQPAPPENVGMTTSPSDKESKATPDAFDAKAPPPDPPTSLFTLWTDNSVIKLIWREAKGAKNYAVEELIDDEWVSIPSIEFPTPNTAIIKNHPTPGPYKFRVRSVGFNGRASEPSRATTARR